LIVSTDLGVDVFLAGMVVEVFSDQ
jgi:hypothetical protein